LALVDCVLAAEGEKKSTTKPVEVEHELPQPPNVVTESSPPSYSEQPEVKPEPVATTVSGTAPVMAAANTPPMEAGSAITQLRLNWKQVIEQAPPDTRKTPAIAILRSAGIKPLSFENNTVVLAFKYKNHKELIEKAENQQVAEKIISNYLGHSCRISCVLEDNHLIKAALRMGAQIIDSEEK
jgi:DNA polymerase-3 subunit gamma/tau